MYSTATRNHFLNPWKFSKKQQILNSTQIGFIAYEMMTTFVLQFPDSPKPEYLVPNNWDLTC